MLPLWRLIYLFYSLKDPWPLDGPSFTIYKLQGEGGGIISRSILGTSRGKLKVSIVLEIFQYRYTSQIITSPGNNALSVLLNYSAFCPNSRGCPGLEDYLPRKSWLDRAMIKYGGSYLDSEVEEVKILGKIIVVFLVLIPYWSIYYQVMYCMCTESCCAYS